jgi:hypothetical protein
MLAVAIEAGARPRTVTRATVACIRAMLPEVWDEPPWRGALYVADAYGRGEMEADAVRQLVPSPRPSGGQRTRDWVAAMERALASRFDTRTDAVAVRATLYALGALHPETEPRDRVKAAAILLESLATIAAFDARASARNAGAEMLEQHRASGGAGIPIAVLPAVTSGAWDEAAQRGFSRGLRACAEAVRELIQPPWSS